MSIPTPHNEARKEEIGKVVLMPGDPNRARWIADNFLHDVKLVNKVRGMLAFTGLTENNKRITVMASGMGNPSMGVYSYELFKEYDVDLIIRVGTCGSYQPNIDFYDVVVGSSALTDSNYGRQLGKDCTYIPQADAEIVKEAEEILKRRKTSHFVGPVFAADVFYDFDKDMWKKYSNMGVLAVEMESFALYVNAEYLGKKALTMLTVTDSFFKEGRLTTEQRQTGLRLMISAAIELAEKHA